MNLVRAFLWIQLLGAVLAEVFAVIARLMMMSRGINPMRLGEQVEVVFLISGMVFLGVMLPAATPVLLEPRRAAVARMRVSPKVGRYAMAAVVSFLGQTCAALWTAHQQGRWHLETIGLALLPLALCVLIIGCCLLLIHFAKLLGQGR